MAKTGKPSKGKDKMERFSDQLKIQNQTLRKILSKITIEGDKGDCENEHKKE